MFASRAAVVAAALLAAAPLPARTLTLSGPTGAGGGPLGALALDGPRAAYVLGNAGGRACPLAAKVFRLDLASGRSTTASGRATCALEQTSTGAGIEAVAAAGSRTAWLVEEGGNTESGETLFASTATPRRERVLARSLRTGDSPPAGAGTWVGGLVSDGTRISYATWTTTRTGSVAASALWRVANGRSHVLARGSGAVVSAAAESGRVALLRGDGTVAVYGIGGALLQTVHVGPARAVALDGDLVAVLTTARTVDVYDRTTGALRHTWPAASGAGPQLDAAAGVVVYATWRSLHALDLATGREAVVATAPRAIRDVDFGRAGLLYDYDLIWTAHAGRLVFVPFAKVAAAVRG